MRNRITAVLLAALLALASVACTEDEDADSIPEDEETSQLSTSMA